MNDTSGCTNHCKIVVILERIDWYVFDLRMKMIEQVVVGCEEEVNGVVENLNTLKIGCK